MPLYAKDRKALQIRLLVILISIMLGVYILDTLTDGSLKQFGVIPRDINSLMFIFPSVWIHGDSSHLINNISLFVVLSLLCMSHRSIAYSIVASLFIIFVGGFILWLIGRYAIHIGASGWIFGLWGLFIADAFFEKNVKSLIIRIAVIVLYNGLNFALLTSEQGISYESHISGLLAGFLFAWFYNNLKKDRTTKNN